MTSAQLRAVTAAVPYARARVVVDVPNDDPPGTITRIRLLSWQVQYEAIEGEDVTRWPELIVLNGVVKEILNADGTVYVPPVVANEAGQEGK